MLPLHHWSIANALQRYNFFYYYATFLKKNFHFFIKAMNMSEKKIIFSHKKRENIAFYGILFPLLTSVFGSFVQSFFIFSDILTVFVIKKQPEKNLIFCHNFVQNTLSSVLHRQSLVANIAIDEVPCPHSSTISNNRLRHIFPTNVVSQDYK